MRPRRVSEGAGGLGLGRVRAWRVSDRVSEAPIARGARRLSRVRVSATLAVVVPTILAAGAVAAAHTAHAPSGTGRARRFAGTATVGALFASASSTAHFCTASVVRSPRGDVLLTAAHCIRGTAAGYVFAPGYYDGISPYGRWTVTAAYLDRGWLGRRDPRRDFAFLTVASRTIDGRQVPIQQLTGANGLDLRPLPGERVTVPAYPAGTDDEQITCTVAVYYDGPYPAFDCTPYPGGTSGAPLLVSTPQGTLVAGVIGGLHQGGCFPFTSYSAPLGEPAWRAYSAAVADAQGDTAPAADSDGC